MSETNLYLQAVDAARSSAAERRLLASVLHDAASCIAGGLDEVHLGHFTSPLTRSVWEAIVDARRGGHAIELPFVGQCLRGEDVLELARLAEEVPSAANFPTYLNELKQSAGKRAVLDGAHKALVLGAERASLEEMSGTLTEALRQADGAAASGRICTLGEILPSALAGFEAPTSEVVPTGFQPLDDALGGGCRPGEMIVLAARPSVGKTSLALVLALETAKRGEAVLFVSQEMGAPELALKALSRDALVNPVAMRKQRENAAPLREKLRASADALSPLRLYIDDTQKFSLQQAKASITRDVHKFGARLVVIDYLGLIPADDRRASAYERTSATSRELKNLARTLGIPLLVLAQLNREVERGAPRDPLLSDLRDSGTIEQDADVVILLARKGERDSRQLIDAIIAKNRNGPCGRVSLLFRPEFSDFVDASSEFDFR